MWKYDSTNDLYTNSLRRGPSSLAPATQDKMHPFSIIQLYRFMQEEILIPCWKQFYASLDGSVRQEMLL